MDWSSSSPERCPATGCESRSRKRRSASPRRARWSCSAPAPSASPTAAPTSGEPCPGAPWQGLAYERQLAEKSDQVGEALRRIGELDGFELEQIEPAVEQWRYRNKLEYSFGERDGEAILGFHARGRWDLIVDVDDCKLASERGNAARNAVREWARLESIPAYDGRERDRACCAT